MSTARVRALRLWRRLRLGRAYDAICCNLLYGNLRTRKPNACLRCGQPLVEDPSLNVLAEVAA